MSMFATPKSGGGHTDELTKDDLIGLLAVFKVTEYNPEQPTSYGTTAIARCHVTLVELDEDLPKTVEESFFAAGNLGRQIGEALDVGQQAPGRIVKGTSANGRSWYGIDWATDEADLLAAEQALSPGLNLPADTPKEVALAALEESLGAQTRADLDSIKRRATAATAQAGADQAPPF